MLKITPEQIRAARALLNLTQVQLAERADTSDGFISWAENMDSFEQVQEPNLDKVQTALSDAGVEFIPWGVRRRPPMTPEQQAMFDELEAISKASGEEMKGREILTDDDMYDENGLPA